MIINTNSALFSINGNQIKINSNDIDGSVKELSKVGDFFCEALLNTYEESKKDGNEKYQCYKLAERIYNSNGSADLSIEEIAKIKTLCGEFYTVKVSGPLFKFFDSL